MDQPAVVGMSAALDLDVGIVDAVGHAVAHLFQDGGAEIQMALQREVIGAFAVIPEQDGQILESVGRHGVEELLPVIAHGIVADVAKYMGYFAWLCDEWFGYSWTIISPQYQTDDGQYYSSDNDLCVGQNDDGGV